MIDHIELQTRDVAACVRFYGDVLAPLGYEQKVDERAKGFGDGKSLDLFIVEGAPSAHVHYAFNAASRTIVDEVYQAAQNHKHDLDRAPALLPHIHPNYYAVFLKDPDGRLVEFVCHADGRT